MQKRNDVRNLVHLIQSKDLTPAQILQAFGEIYLSKNEKANQETGLDLVKISQSVKAPYYGVHIPNTSAIAQADGSAGGIIPLFTPTANKTYQFMAGDVTNAGSGSVSVDFGLTDGQGTFIKMSNTGPSSGGGQNAIEPRNFFYFDSTVYPAFLVRSGTASDVLVTMAYAEVIQ